jgi:Ca2+-binding RTX toxin-like protein
MRILPMTFGIAAVVVTATVAVTAAPAARQAPAAGAAPLSIAASSGSDATIETKIVPIDPGKSVDATATCPAGKRVMGGGVGQPPATSSFGFIQQSAPVDETGAPADTTSGDVGRSWFASIENPGNTQREFRVFAICSATSDATIQSGLVSVGGGTDGNVSVGCPAGARAVDGGVGLVKGSDFGVALLQRSGPVDETGKPTDTGDGEVARSWFVSVHNLTSAALDFKVFAICSATSDATIAATTFSLDATRLVEAKATCPTGKRAVGGGLGEVSGLTPPYGFLLQSGPVDETGSTVSTDSGDVARGWAVSALNTTIVPRVFRVFAICAADAAPSTPAGSTARCAGLKATIAGTAGPDRLVGTPGPDVIAGLGGNDTISGLGGNDIVCGGGGNDTIAGGPGNDRLYGELGNDNLNGGPGNDLLVGGPGVDRITGGPGSNVVKP